MPILCQYLSLGLILYPGLGLPLGLYSGLFLGCGINHLVFGLDLGLGLRLLFGTVLNLDAGLRTRSRCWTNFL